MSERNFSGLQGASPGGPPPRMADLLVSAIISGPLMQGRPLPSAPRERDVLVRDVWDLAEALVAEKRRRAEEASR